MSQIRELHDKAMQLAQLAIVIRHQGALERARELARQAYELEQHAAELLPANETSEPTRSILYRSAASLAYQCKEFKIAQKLIAKGLSGSPPPQIERELHELMEYISDKDSQLDLEFQAWDTLSDEALINFERELG